MALDALLDRLSRETGDQVAALLDAARRDAEASTRATAIAGDQARAARLADLESAHQATLAREAEAARRRGTLALLEARRDAIGRVLARVRERFAEASGDAGYLAGLVGELDDAVAVLGGRPAVLHAAPAVAAIASGRPGAMEEIIPDPGLAGFRLASRDGRIEVDATLEERLRRLAPAVAIEVVRSLEVTP